MFGVPDERVGGLMEKAMIHGCEPSDLVMGGVECDDVSMGVRERLAGVCDAYFLEVTIKETGCSQRFHMKDGAHMSLSSAQAAVNFSGKKIDINDGNSGRDVNAGRLRDQMNGLFSRCFARIIDER